MTPTPAAAPPKDPFMVQATDSHQHSTYLGLTTKPPPDQQARFGPENHSSLSLRHNLNITTEVGNLRHKLRVLRAFADDKQLLSKIPVLSEVEEARQLQYQIECIEAACLEQGHNLRDPHMLDTSGLGEAPLGFSDWLDKNLSSYDPVARGWAPVGEAVPRINSLDHRRLNHRHFPKCADESCIHYIYGFLEQDGLHHHRLSHMAQAKRDSGLSVGEVASSSPLSLESTPGLPPINEITLAPNPSSPIRLSTGSSLRSNKPKMPLLSQMTQHREQRGSDAPVSFFPGITGVIRPHSFVGAEVDVDPQLPPLKRSRVGPSRLESIGELRLPVDVDACLSCRSLQIECDYNGPICFHCSSASAGNTTDSLCSIIGCHRGPLSRMACVLVPAFSYPNLVDTPMASPLAQRLSLNDYLEKAYSLHTDATRVVKTNLDFDDAFWWVDDLTAVPSINPTDASFGVHPMDQPPPVLRVLASSHNISATAYNFWQLLKLSGLLSVNRHDEAIFFPSLYRGKLLLREVLFLALQQPDSCIVSDTRVEMTSSGFDEYECYSRHRVVTSCAAQFLESIESSATKQDPMSSKSWLAVFISLCIFSIARTILSNTFLFRQRCAPGLSSDETAMASDRIDAVYKVSIAIFRGRLPTFLDLDHERMQEDDRELYNTASMIVKRETWQDSDIDSTASFLLSLGSVELGTGIWHGFLRLVGPRNNSETVHHSLAASEHTNSKHSVDQGRYSAESGVAVAVSVQNASGSNVQPSFGNHGQLPLPFVLPSEPKVSPQHLPALRLHCRMCNENPDGFCGEHALQRHVDTRHAKLVTRWVCTEPDSGSTATALRPAIPLSKCEACMARKSYDAFDNAAAHLRHAHFSPYRISTPNSEWPSMSVLSAWIQEIHRPLGRQEGLTLSDSEGDGCNDLINGMSQAAASASFPRDAPHFPSTTVPVNDPAPGLTGAQRSPQEAWSLVKHPQTVSQLSPTRPASAIFAQPPPAVQLPSNEQLGLQMPQLRAKQHQQLPHTSLSQDMPQVPVKPPAIAPIVSSPALDQLRQTKPNQAPGSLHRQAAGSRGVGQRHTNRNRCPHPECGRVYKDIAAHMLTHMEERPEKCPIETCEYHTKGFARKYDKNRHALTHYKGNMVCPFCNGVGTAYEKAFNRADVFKRHLTAVHNVEQTPPNSKKTATTPGGYRNSKSTREDSGSCSTAKCSICGCVFTTAQYFYEHLDDCVLNVIVPSALKATDGTTSTAPSGESPTSTAMDSIAQTTGLLP